MTEEGKARKERRTTGRSVSVMVYMPIECAKAIQELADQDERSVSAFIRRMCMQRVAQKQPAEVQP